jgi:hypothetical protein
LAFRCFGCLGWAAWYSLVASMIRCRCSGPLVPGERRGILAVFLEVSVQKVLQILFRTVYALRQLSVDKSP